MDHTPSLIAEKVAQAGAILAELEVDCWLTFVRETAEAGDPVLPLILGQDLTWQSALLLTRAGDRIAIVGKYDDGAVRAGGVWSEVIPYVEGIRTPLVETLKRIDPATIAINFSRSDVKADGLSHGLYLVLLDHLEEHPYGERLIAAERILEALKVAKTPSEVERLRRAIATTDEIFARAAAELRPGHSELAVSRFFQEQAVERGLGLAWDPHACPIVTTGPDSMIGHGTPSADLTIREGCIFHVDFGVRQDEYCSDLQRCWYVPRPNELHPPEPVVRAFETVRAAIEAAAEALRPGVAGWEVDAAARHVIIDAGYPEYQHATGHHVGRAAHDGGGVLGPRWERYGETPLRPLEAGNVVTLELGIEDVDGRGYLGLEEMLLVTNDGSTYLSQPQTTLPLLGD